MRLLTTLNQITDRLLNNNFQFIKNWADSIAGDISAIQTDLDAAESDIDDIEAILSPNVKFTTEGGIAVRIKNGTGSPSVVGTLVSASPTTDLSFVLQSNEYDTFGIVYEGGVAAGEYCWVVVSGIAQVLMKDNNDAIRGYTGIAADTDGRAITIEVPSANPVVEQHFKEIGHCIETKAAGTNVLAKFALHFN